MARWGIAGISKISHDFCIALNSKLTAMEHNIVAVASRSGERASGFAKEHSISVSYNSYEGLARDTQVQVVYIAVLNPFHFEVSKLMITHKKHVVCEKPLAMNYAQAKELFALAKQYQVLIIEGLWSRFFPVYRHLSSLIEDGRLGIIKEIYVKHGFKGIENDRIVKKELGGGILLDIGCYAIQFVLFVFREVPKTISAKGKVNADGVDLYFETELTFSDGRKAIIVCSGLSDLENQATIITTKGPICIPQYWCPTKYVALGEIHKWKLVNVPDVMNFSNSIGLKYEADEVAKCILANKLICSLITPEDSMLIAQIQDEIRRQLGVEYICDKNLVA